jgi:site-specific DNA-cytosine methylase
VTTIRKRYFAVFIRKDLTLDVQWPSRSHTKQGREASSLVDAIPKWKPFKDICHTHNIGESIMFERHAEGSKKSVLSRNTLNRMRAGLQKYWKEGEKVQLVDSHHFTSTPVSLDRPAPTIMACRDQYLLTLSFLVHNYSCGGKEKTTALSLLSAPLPSIPTKDRFAFIRCQFIHNKIGADWNHQSMSQPLGSILTVPKQGLVTADFDVDPDKVPFILELASDPPSHDASLWKIYGPYRVDRRIRNIHYRMLNEVELKLAQGFPAGYHLDPDSTTRSKYFVGNSIPPPLCAKIIQANIIPYINRVQYQKAAI